MTLIDWGFLALVVAMSVAILVQVGSLIVDLWAEWRQRR